MSSPAFDRCLPPGDRNDAPDLAPAPPPVATAALPGADLAIDALARSLDEAQAAFGAVRLARAHEGLPALEACTHRLVALARHLDTTVTAARVRERGRPQEG